MTQHRKCPRIAASHKAARWHNTNVNNASHPTMRPKLAAVKHWALRLAAQLSESRHWQQRCG